MPGVYDAADVYLNAPDIDNMPGSILEAFASGLPVVTTDAGGIPYMVRDGENGLIVPRGDRKSTRLNSSHGYISYAVFCLKKKNTNSPPALSLSTTMP